MTESIRETIKQRLLVVDALPWYSVADDYDSQADRAFRALGLRTMGSAEVRARCAELARVVLRPRDLVVLPLMSGALLLEPVTRRAREIGATVVTLPLSRHPFVTLSADAPKTLSSAAMAADFTRLLKKTLPRFSRIVFLDSNSATGKDFVLFRERLALALGDTIPMHFSVLISEMAENPAFGPGHRGGPKLKQPDSAAVGLVGSNTRFLSHLRFLRMGLDAQIEVADRIRSALPDLTAYWETVPAPLRSIHNYEQSNLMIHRKRLHVRHAADDDHRADELARVVGLLDAESRPEVGPEVLRFRAELLLGWQNTLEHGQ
jgi:hypothetical protein